jgi:hypothetical protein
MIVSSYGNGFGQSQAPSALVLIQVAQDRARMRGGVNTGYGFGAAVSDFSVFQAAGAGTTYKSDDGLVYCTKDNANRPQCVLNKAGESGKAPIRNMQRAADRVIDLIPTNGLAGRQMKGQMPSGDGSTSEQIFTVPSNLMSPVGAQSGYDGVVGASTMQFTVLALTLAGMLKKFPNPGIALAFVSPTRTDIYAKYSTEIADYLNDVADHFPALLSQFNERGNVPIQTQLDVSTIPFVVPKAGEQRSKWAPIVMGAAAMVGLTTVGAVAAGKHKPGFLYTSPALGRRRSRSR